MVWHRNSTDDPNRFSFEWYCAHCGRHLYGTSEPPDRNLCPYCGKWASLEDARDYWHRGPDWAPPSTVYR